MATKRKRKERGRPVENQLPPRIDATPERIAQVFLAAPPGRKWQYKKGGGAEYRCGSCQREVSYPDTMYEDGNCQECHLAAVVQ